MTIDEFVDDPEVAARARTLSFGLLRWRGMRAEELAVRAADSARLPRETAFTTPFSYLALLDLGFRSFANEEEALAFAEVVGVFGAGAVREDGASHPLVVVAEGLAGDGPHPVAAAPQAANIITRAIGEPPRDDVYVWGVPEPELYFGPSTSVRAGAARGTLGAVVETRDGRLGILTAGHVAHHRANTIVCEESRVGVVTALFDPAQLPVGAGASPDIALVEIGVLSGGLEEALLPIAGDATAPPLTPVTSYGGETGRAPGRVLAFCEWFAAPQAGGSWADVYLTETAISQPGDSGAPVLLDDGRVVGHVVGGAAGTTTIVQDIHTQLNALDVTLRVTADVV